MYGDQIPKYYTNGIFVIPSLKAQMRNANLL
jgi:hypothetical protein